jgi:hypothetical protein
MLVKRLSRPEAAEYLTKQGYHTTKGTLAKLACLGGGPRYATFGSRATYTPEDLDEWAEGRLQHRLSTSDAA